MPVAFLTDEQAKEQGSQRADAAEQERVTFPEDEDEDRNLIAKRRVDNKCILGLARQMCTVRYSSRVLEDPLAVPWPADDTHFPLIANHCTAGTWPNPLKA